MIEKGKRPNVIFVFSDQHRYQANGYAYNGDQDVITPNLDALAAESINFTHAVSGCPVCSPYRGSLLTGTFPQTHGVFINDVCLSHGRMSMADAFSLGGYDTAYIGKWHLDGHGRTSYIPKERRQGFDYWKVLECTHNYNQSAYYAHDDESMKHWDGYDAQAQTKDAVTYIQEHDGIKPFLLMLSLGPPHNPYDSAPKAFKDLYKPEELSLRPNVPIEEAPFRVMYGDEVCFEDEEVVRDQLAGYYAHVSAIDALIGQLIKTISEEGLTEDTVFIYTSDHGDMLYSGGQAKKQKPWDESILVPFLLRYPGLLGEEGREIDIPLETPDIMPTLLDLCGIKIPDSVEGQSLLPYMQGEQEDEKAALLMCLHPFGEYEARKGGRAYRGIRTARYTYVKDLNGPWLLYDNAKDPYQLKNLIDEVDQKDLLSKLEMTLSNKLKERGDRFLEGQAYIDLWGYEVDQHGTVGSY